MIKLFGKLTTGFLSTITFLAAFAVAGDVLIAVAIAIAGAAAQFVLTRTGDRKPDVTSRAARWASLALVLVVTGTTLAGVDADSAELRSPTSVSCTAPHCVCQMTVPI